MAPPRKSVLPKPLPDSFILIDTEKKKWRLGKIIGQGGFGLIYLGNEFADTSTHINMHTQILLQFCQFAWVSACGKPVDKGFQPKEMCSCAVPQKPNST